MSAEWIPSRVRRMRARIRGTFADQWNYRQHFERLYTEAIDGIYADVFDAAPHPLLERMNRRKAEESVGAASFILGWGLDDGPGKTRLP